MDAPGPLAPRLIQARRGFSVGYRGKTLLSTVDPIAQAGRAVEAAPLRDGTLYLCPSPLLGYGLPRLLERIETGAPASAILCVEADKELGALSLNQDGGPSLIPPLCSHPRFCFLSIGGASGAGGNPKGTEEGPDAEGERICALVRRRWGSRRFRRVEILRLSGAWQLYPELYKTITEALRGAVATDWANAITLVKLGRRYIRNAIRNLASIPRSPPISSLSFGRTPVLVLGAGPSLDRFLDTLGPDLAEPSPRGGAGGAPDRAGRSFGIICVDTVLPNLKARGIRPDLVIALESQHWNLRDFVGVKNWGVPLAMDLSALPATAGALGGPCAVFMTPWTELALFRRLKAADLLPEQFPPLGSVGLCAAALALRLSGGPVVCCGIDFSFTLDSYHARSTPGHREKLRGQNRFRGILNQAAAFREGAFEGLSKSGLPVRSDPAMRNYRDLFEREFAAESRLRDLGGSGLPLGIPSLGSGEAAAILRAGAGETAEGAVRAGFEGPAIEAAEPGYDAAKARRLKEFILGERGALERLRDILRGEQTAEPGAFEELLDFCDYLWAHFPECAAAGGRRPPGTDIAFLKRVRAEIDPFLRLMELSLREC